MAQEPVDKPGSGTNSTRSDHFNYLLPSSTLLKMTSVVLSEDVEAEDHLVWGEEPDGVYMVNKAYRKLNTHDSVGGRAGWRPVWQLKIQQRVRMFLWLLSHSK